MTALATALFIIAVLLLVSVLASKISDRLGVPSLLLFLLIGMVAGAEGLGGIRFSDPSAAMAAGTVALAFILFSGGLETRWSEVRPVIREGLSLATLGVLLTAAAVGGFAVWVLKFTWLQGLLLGAIVSSTDAAAVFTVLRSRHVGLKGRLQPLLEFESGSNDPMAVFLTLGLISLARAETASWLTLIPRFALDMGVGAALGFLLPRAALLLINRIRLEFEGLYPVLTVGLVLLTYAAATLAHGNGFLAVYIAGIVIGNNKFLHKKSLTRFHEGLVWLMQIGMFLLFGLMMLPSRLVPLAGIGLAVSLFIIFIARPLSVFICLAPTALSVRERLLISWVGLRGAVPIILATFPLLAGIEQSGIIFQLMFFVVSTSVLIQGTSIPLVAKWLGVEMPMRHKRYTPLDFEEVEGINANMQDLLIPYQSAVVGKTIFEIGVPKESLIVLISKNDRFLIPNGSTRLEGGDVLFVLANKPDLLTLQKIIAKQKPVRTDANEA